MKLLLVPLLLLAAIAVADVLAFQSDELPEDAEEWGLVGDAPPLVIRPKPLPETLEPAPGRAAKPAKGGAAPGVPKKISFPLEHSFGDGRFEQIGSFSGILKASVGLDSTQQRQVITKLRLLRNPLTKAEKSAFEELVKNDGFYTVRIPASLIQPTKKQILASVKARCLAAANLKERFDLFIDQGNLIGVGYSPIGDCGSPRPEVYPNEWTFESLIVAKGNEQAPRLISRFEDLDPLRAGENLIEGEEGVKVIEKTFWQKYWMYIVPFALIAINGLSQLAVLPEDEPPGQGAPGQGVPAIAAPAQRGGASGGGRNRR